MRKNQVSLTAVGIAMARAIESEKPAGERVCYDPYARRFVPAWMYYIFGFFIKTGYAEWRSPGVNGFLVGRERYIDDVLLDSLGNGMQQLVILGAGFDSRAYRFDLAGRVKTFEVDHPVTQENKIARLEQIFGKTPAHVTFVPIDFNTQSLDERLPEMGYDPGLKTLFIWQGVTMYLTAEAVDATLNFVAHNSSPGSAIIFDYIYRQALDGSQKPSEVNSMQRYRFMSGEGLTFGIAEGSVEDFLKGRGFNQAVNMDAAGLKQAYFTGINVSRKIAGRYGIATGIV
jgi:methyltransferase (TIGR00027 family)